MFDVEDAPGRKPKNSLGLIKSETNCFNITKSKNSENHRDFFLVAWMLDFEA
jgi:hypothetical protein